MTVSRKLIFPSWEEVCDLVEILAEQARGYLPDVVVGMARGGLVPARLIVDNLAVSHLFTVGVSLYKDIGESTNNPFVTQPLNFPIKGRRILVVDDVVDSGKSLFLVLTELRKTQSEIRTATLYKKPWSELMPDYYAKMTDAWIVFPWEIRETIRKIYKRWHSGGKELEDIEKYLLCSGMDAALAHDLVSEVVKR